MQTQRILVLVCILAMASLTQSYHYSSLKSQPEAVYPFIVEYIDKFSIGSNDVEMLLTNQFKIINLPSINSSSFEIFNNSVSLSYKGTSKVVDQISPLKVKVVNDSFSVAIQFNIRVLHVVGGKNYSCQTKISDVLISYIKEVDFASGNTLIKDLSSSFSSKSFSEPTCKEAIATKDKSAIQASVNSTQNASLYLELKKTLNKTQQYLSFNAKQEHLSQVYIDNPYSYDFYGFKIEIIVSTIQANTYGETGIENQISGVITETSTQAVAPPKHLEPYSTFISIEFIANFIEYCKTNFGGWKNIRLTKSNMRTTNFKFRLIDFEYIIPSVLNKYPSRYLADVDIQCSAEQVKEIILDEKFLTVGIDWRCIGSFEDEDKKKVTFLNFLIGIKHELELLATQQSILAVRTHEIQLNNLQFDYIGSYQVVDPFTAAQFISEGLFEFKVFTVGTYFKINNPNRQIKHIPDRGIWIG